MFELLTIGLCALVFFASRWAIVAQLKWAAERAEKHYGHLNSLALSTRAMVGFLASRFGQGMAFTVGIQSLANLLSQTTFGWRVGIFILTLVPFELWALRNQVRRVKLSQEGMHITTFIGTHKKWAWRDISCFETRWVKDLGPQLVAYKKGRKDEKAYISLAMDNLKRLEDWARGKELWRAKTVDQERLWLSPWNLGESLKLMFLDQPKRWNQGQLDN